MPCIIKPGDFARRVPIITLPILNKKKPGQLYQEKFFNNSSI